MEHFQSLPMCVCGMSSKIGELAIDKATLEARIVWNTKSVIGYYISPCSAETVSLCNSRCCNSVPLTLGEAEKFKGNTHLKNRQYYLDDENYQCTFLDGKNRCKTYNTRPLVCQAHPVGLMQITAKDNTHFQLILKHCETEVVPVTKDSPKEQQNKAEELNNILAKRAQQFYTDNLL